jgi:hypothetical protein
MAVAAAVVLDNQMHLLDAILPDDVVVLPEGGHLHVLLVDPLLAVNVGAGASVAGLLALVRDVTQRPGGGRAALGFLDHLGADVNGAVPVIDRLHPVLGAIGVKRLAADIIVRLTGFGIVGVFLGEGEGFVEQHELLRVATRTDQCQC